MDTVSNAMGKRSGMSPVDDFIREMLAASPQGRINESFEALRDDPAAQQFEPSTPGVMASWPGNNEKALQATIAEAMQQPPIPTEEMNARPYPPVTGTIEDDAPDYGPPGLDPENSPQDYIAQNFPRGDERLATPGWIPSEEPGVAENEVSRFDDRRNASTSRTMGSVPGATAPFRLRGPVNMQLTEENNLMGTIRDLLSRFR